MWMSVDAADILLTVEGQTFKPHHKTTVQTFF